MLSEDLTDKIDLANEILLCGIAFLLGGYEPCQISIANELIADSNNKVFVTINNLISKLGDLIEKNYRKNTEGEALSERNFSVTTIDTFDYYSTAEKSSSRKNVLEPDDAKEEEYKRLCISTYRRSFKFLQLMCENNNENNKRLMKEQLVQKSSEDSEAK